VKAGSSFREDAGNAPIDVSHGAADRCRTDSKPRSRPPTRYDPQADVSSRQTAMGWALPAVRGVRTSRAGIELSDTGTRGIKPGRGRDRRGNPLDKPMFGCAGGIRLSRRRNRRVRALQPGAFGVSVRFHMARVEPDFSCNDREPWPAVSTFGFRDFPSRTRHHPRRMPPGVSGFGRAGAWLGHVERGIRRATGLEQAMRQLPASTVGDPPRQSTCPLAVNRVELELALRQCGGGIDFNRSS